MNKKRVRIFLFFAVIGIIAIVVYGKKYGSEKQKAEHIAEVKKQDDDASAKMQAEQRLATEHQQFVEKYVDTGITKRPGYKMVAVAVASENRVMNHALAAALINRFKTNNVQLTDSFFKPELVTDGLFGSAYNGSTDLFNKLNLTNSLDALLLARQSAQFETNADANNVILAHMSLEITALPVAGQMQSQTWFFTANGSGFRRNEAWIQAEERIVQQIESDTKMSLGL